MPNGSPTKTTTDSQPWVPPKGIRYEYNKQRPTAPFLLRWRGNDGEDHSQSFADAEAREKHAKHLADLTLRHGSEVLNFDPLEWRRWLELKEKLAGMDPMDLYREWQSLSGNPGGAPMTVEKAVKTYMEFRAEGKISADTRRHFEKHLEERFAGEFGSLKLRDVNPDLITKWLRELKHPKTGEPMEPVTKRHHRKDLNTFLDYCSRVRGWIPRNPCEAVAVPAVEDADVTLLTLAEGRSLFAKNEGNPVVGRLALEAFGFLRASSAGRIQKADIDFAARGIRLRGAEHKSGKTRFRQGHPDNLWAWLKRAPDETWAMKWWEYRNEKRVAFRVAGIKGGSENRLRKTCLSAHLAWLKNQPLTSLLAQHRHTSTTEIYLGVMDEKDGEAWFNILPTR